MCVSCYVGYGGSEHRARITVREWFINYYVGGWRNFIPKRRRGEVNPAPWLIIWKRDVCGIQIAAQRSRPWFRPEHRVNNGTHFLGWGIFILSWRTS